MRNYLFCFFIIIQCPVFGQGWVRQFGSNDQREVFQTVFPATDSTVWCVGDSLDSKYIRFKEIDFKGNVLRDSSFNSINSSPNYGMSAIRKKDFGLVHVSYYSVNINWSAYSSLSYYQVISNDFVSFNGGVQNGGTGNDYRYFMEIEYDNLPVSSFQCRHTHELSQQIFAREPIVFLWKCTMLQGMETNPFFKGYQ